MLENEGQRSARELQDPEEVAEMAQKQAEAELYAVRQRLSKEQAKFIRTSYNW